MSRDFVKVRKVGQTLVVTLTQEILSKIELKEGERVMLEAEPPSRILILKEKTPMTSTRRSELELEVLKSKRDLLGSEIAFLTCQHNNSMPVEQGADDALVVELRLSQLNRDANRLDVAIAEKELELFDSVGA